jgi:hypothetical protein
MPPVVRGWRPFADRVDIDQDPLDVPEITRLIARATGKQPRTRRKEWIRQQQGNTTRGIPVPLEIAVIVIDAIYNDDNYSWTSASDTWNLLDVAQWELPDWYWKRRCRKDLTFEFDDFINTLGDWTSTSVVDWQYLCLESEKLLLSYRWYDTSGLKNRGRIFACWEPSRRDFDICLKKRKPVFEALDRPVCRFVQVPSRWARVVIT